MTELGGSPQARGCPAAAMASASSTLADLAPSSCLSEILGEPPYASPGTFLFLYASGAWRLPPEDASRPQVRVRSRFNLSFHPRFVACGAASSPALRYPSPRGAVADPTRARLQNPARCR